LIICDPESSKCYWTQFRLDAVEPTEEHWKITIPFENELLGAKSAIEKLLGAVKDGDDLLEKYWQVNRLIRERSTIVCIADKQDVLMLNVDRWRSLLDRLQISPDLAFHSQGKVELIISGYDDDPRELYEIPEVRKFIQAADRELPDLFFFARNEEPSFSLQLFALCQAEVEVIGQDSEGKKKTVSVELSSLGSFVERHCYALNDLCDKIKMPMEDQEELFGKIVTRLGLGEFYKPSKL
jgi:hypothetical protein